jgi:hypothetical protein
MKWRDPLTGIEHSLIPDEQFSDEMHALAQWWACAHETTKLVWSPISGGGRQLRRQCLRCFEIIGSTIPHNQASHDTSMADLARREQRHVEHQSRRDDIIRRLARREADWWARYNEYLTTEKWQRIRARVMERARDLCEGCRERPAQQVHHLTYKHVGDEFLFELVAVCEACHERIHRALNEGPPS